ncbi:Type I secretion system membrane fusion protein PrsE [Roseobacter fucihabitans]|uniref:Membrane fusion protein (MFP) family protein n=1 Tax=Roseobacter fucihabitans TaxID=1537242 RepID=A0ABZ2BLP1_9RHOB|nr:HlyD family type I secretion periplasmic adaptor subunit [Roseobacter litoralis]MBC6963371.1 Type I secretion system membrane fusion protein PrsE [Roseobacter litoralis]
MSASYQDDETLTSYRPTLIAALLISLGMILAILGWSMFARLDAAIVANGILHAESDRKTVQHLEGGILAELFVRPGDAIKAGQVVARLDDTQISERLVQLRAEYEFSQFTLWRLSAEQDGIRPDPDIAPDLGADQIPKRRAQTVAAMALYEARLQNHNAQIAALDHQIAQRRAQIDANTGLARSSAAQLASWTTERETINRLVQSGAAPERRLWELDRAIAVSAGTRDENEGLIAAARQDIARAVSDKEALTQTRLASIASELSDARRTLLTLNSQIRAAEDIRERHLMRAPHGGRVVDISVVTTGAVLGPGQVLMEILPADDQLIALVRLAPNAIDSVKPGGPAKVRMIAYKRSDAPLVNGTLSFVSPDILEDPATQTPYFEARVTLDADDLGKLDETPISAGMPVEVTLVIGTRRAGDYLIEPFARHFRRAFREE